MKIGILSDTHIPGRAKCLPPALYEIFDGVELIIHAGDVVDEQVLSDLSVIAPVEAVAGNMDPEMLTDRLGRKKILTLTKFRIGLIHGDAGKGSSTPKRALAAFAQEGVDCVVFGHSHRPYCHLEKGVLLFNPGSPTDRRREPRHSCGIITLGKEIIPKIVYL